MHGARCSCTRIASRNGEATAWSTSAAESNPSPLGITHQSICIYACLVAGIGDAGPPVAA